MAVSFFLTFALRGGALYFMLLIRSLQMVLHIPIFRVILPANTSMVFSYIISVAMFDFLEADWTTKLVLQFDEFRQMEL